ncbi:unnamed protein product [Durusdinium trenchii]|uniref:Cyclin-dependent kinases regulatory subunit n=2 Tax=Durusdinium trenchii TaxID=1381693 RepID=A0ABP0MG63_9DINO
MDTRMLSLTQQVANWADEMDYSDKYCDDIYEYRRVTIPRNMVTALPVGRTMEEWEWRQNGITMSRGWEHYDHHAPEANVLLFRRVLGTDPKTGQIPPKMALKVQQRNQYVHELEQERQRMIQEQAQREQTGGMEY